MMPDLTRAACVRRGRSFHTGRQQVGKPTLVLETLERRRLMAFDVGPTAAADTLPGGGGATEEGSATLVSVVTTLTATAPMVTRVASGVTPTATVTVTRSGDVSGPLVLPVKAVGGTARPGSDYRRIPLERMKVRFAAGESSADLAVPLLPTRLRQPEEFLQLRIGSPRGSRPRVTTTVTLGRSGQMFLSEPTAIANGWSTFPVLTQGDAVRLAGGRRGERFAWTEDDRNWDGLGAYQSDGDTLRVLVNNETANGRVNRVDLNVPRLKSWIERRVVGNTTTNQKPRPLGLIEGVRRAWDTVASGDGTLTRPCSGNVWEADTFAPGMGFADRLYLFGEETFGEEPWGHICVIDTATDTLYEVPDVGGPGSWENATPIDTGRTDTIAILLGEDRGEAVDGTAPLTLYVGLKNPSGSFLERNGLVGGKNYTWDADGTSVTDGTMGGGIFARNNDVATGTWRLSSTEAVLFSKAEDVHTNMQPSSAGFGRQGVVASQGEALFLVDFLTTNFVAGDLAADQRSDVRVLFEQRTDHGDGSGATGLFGGMDNMTWCADGTLVVNEDDGEGDVWRIRVDDLLADYRAGVLDPSGENVYQLLDADAIPGIDVTESSGVIDISAHLGYDPGLVFLTNGMGDTADQLVMFVAPTIGRGTATRSAAGSRAR
jgi:hypothetical protein